MSGMIRLPILVILAALAVPDPAPEDGKPTIRPVERIAFDAASRGGAHHVTIAGRVVDESGRPIGRADVTLSSKRHRVVSPIERATTAADGRFSFADISAFGQLRLHIAPPEHLRERSLDVHTIDARTTDLGDVAVGSRTTLRGRVSWDAAHRPASRRMTIAVDAKDPGVDASSNPPSQTLKSDEEFRFDALVGEEHEISVLTTLRGVGRVSYRGTLRLEPGTRDRYVVIRPLVESHTAGDDLTIGRFDLTTEVREREPEPDAVRITGRVVDGRGEPMPGARVRLMGGSPAEELTSVVITDAEGAFGFRAADLSRRWIEVHHLGVVEHVFHSPTGREPSSHGSPGNRRYANFADPVEIPYANSRPLELRSEGVDAPHYDWWNHDRWIPLPADASVPLGALAHIRARAQGQLPRTTTIELARAYRGVEVDVDEVFSAKIPITIGSKLSAHVRDPDGSPVAGAWIDLDEVRLPDPDATPGGLYLDEREPQSLRIPLGSYRTDANGNFEIGVEPDAQVEGFVYAPGFRPERFAARGGGAVSVALERGEPRSAVPLASDERPTLRIVPPPVIADAKPHDPWVQVSPAKLLYGRPVVPSVRGFGGTDDFPDLHLTEIAEDGSIRVTLLAEGPMTLTFGSPKLDATFERTILAKRGTHQELSFPSLDARFAGAFATYQPARFAHHGVAGPRLALRPKEPDAWTAIVYVPKRARDGSFEVAGLPAGDVFVDHHLTTTMKGQLPRSDTPPGPGLRAFYGYGGRPVRLRANDVTAIEDFADIPVASLVVEVVDASGALLREGAVRVRDRLYESWHKIETGPTTAAYADDPIAPPPWVAIRDGRAELPRIRPGRIEILVRDGFRAVHRFVLDTEPGRPIRLALPEAR